MNDQLITFLSGVATGIILVALYIQYKVSQIRKTDHYAEAKKMMDNLRKESGLDSLEEKLDKMSSIKDKLIKAGEIAQQQSDLRDQAQQPSKNSMHSRYKNGLIGEMNRLEEEKNAILRSILEDGFDPVITAIDSSGESRQMTLSEFLAGAPAPETPVEPGAPRKAGKFTVHNGGKSDGGETTH